MRPLTEAAEKQSCDAGGRTAATIAGDIMKPLVICAGLTSREKEYLKTTESESKQKNGECKRKLPLYLSKIIKLINDD